MSGVPREAILRDHLFEIRPLRADEAGLLCAAVQSSIDEIGRWETWCVPDYGIEQARAHLELAQAQWEEGLSYNFNIIELATQSVVGSVSLNQIDRHNRRANLGYWTRTSHVGRGLAPLAVRTLARFAFRKVDLVRLEIVAQAGNVLSRRVAEKVGARFECVARDRIMYRGEPRAAAVYCLIRSDLGARPVVPTALNRRKTDAA